MRRRYEADLEATIMEEARLRETGVDCLTRSQRIIALCNGLKDRYVGQSTTESAKLLKIVTSNLRTDGVTIRA